MKKANRIARIELSALFYSPIAWFMVVVFSFQAGLAFLNVLRGRIVYQTIMPELYTQRSFFQIATMFGPPNGFLPGIVSRLFLYLPLVTMGLISREFSSGTIKLLYSSPINTRDIVWGKFLAMMVYNLFLLLPLVLIASISAIIVQHADCGLLLTQLLGIYMLLCAYSAIGLFVSCLTSYPVVAAVGTLTLLTFLYYVGSFWQGVDFVRDLTWFLSLAGRTNHQLVGLLTTKDVIYFIVVTGLFLAWSIHTLQSSRNAKPFWFKIALYPGILVLALAIGYVTARPALVGYLDATSTGANTLTKITRDLIDSLRNKKLTVSVYDNLLDRDYQNLSPEARNSFLEIWEPYLRYKSDIHFKYVYYYDSTFDEHGPENDPHILRTLAENVTVALRTSLSGFKTPQEIRKMIDLSPEHNRPVMDLECGGRHTWLRTNVDNNFFPDERRIAAALKRLLITPPIIGVWQGDLERDIYKKNEKSYFQPLNNIESITSLVNNGFDVDTFSENRPIPPNVGPLVIADPHYPFSARALTALRAYIDDGGNLLATGEPGRQDVLNPLLQSVGVRFLPGTLMEKSKDFNPDLILASILPAAFKLSIEMGKSSPFPISMRGAAALAYDSSSAFTVQPLLVTDARTTWNRLTPITDTQRLAYSPETGDRKGAFVTAVALTRQVNGHEQRIVVTGDADFMADGGLYMAYQQTYNTYFCNNLFCWLSENVFPMPDTRPPSPEWHLYLTLRGYKNLRIVLLAVVPTLLLITGTILLIRRKRQ
jgi:ABC-2 type transport system permease protein